LSATRLIHTLLLSILLLPINGVAQTEDIASQQLKALFIYNFANFVDWPVDAFDNETDQLRICLLGQVPFARFLSPFDKTQIGERELAIILATKTTELNKRCQLLFVGEQYRNNLPILWQEIKYLYVLSVGQEEGFTEQGGIVNIVRTSDNVQFDINISNALEQGLELSSDLLSLAKEIKENKSK
jgi:hypothetical protein